MSLHDNTPLEIRTGDGEPRWRIVFAHGRGATPEGSVEFVRKLGLDAQAYLLRAEDQAWYPEGFMASFSDNEPWLSAAIAHFESVVSDIVSSGVDPETIIVGGFSQGACLTSEWLARHPRRLGAAFVLTGGLIGPKGTSWDAKRELEGMPVYQSSSEDDPWIPAERARETADWFRRSGADLTMRMFEHREHTVSDEEVEQLRDLLGNLTDHQ